MLPTGELTPLYLLLCGRNMMKMRLRLATVRARGFSQGRGGRRERSQSYSQTVR
jgi:hypothetical protein